MFNFVIRAIGCLLFVIGALIVTADMFTVAEGDFESTVLHALALVGWRTGAPAWMPVVWWVLPMLTGVIFVIMPPSRTSRQIREEALQRQRERGLPGNQ